MKLNLVPISLARHLRCISVRGRRDRAPPYRLKGVDGWSAPFVLDPVTAVKRHVGSSVILRDKNPESKCMLAFTS